MHESYRPTQPQHEIITRFDLADGILDAEVVEFQLVLEELGVGEVVYECDGGRGQVPTALVDEVLRSDEPVVQLTPWSGTWRSDPTFYVPASDVEFEVCHERQVHLRTDNAALLERFWSRWKARGYAFGRRCGTEWEWEDPDSEYPGAGRAG